jgi:uncharacterized protein (TIGR02453 family)
LFPPEGLRFLKSLKRNNNRDWFAAHKTEYESFVRTPMIELVESLATEFARFAPDILSTPKASLYRIHRDTRFSQDKRPYKTHVAAVFSSKSLSKHEGAGFYFHIAPDELLLGGGLYMPEPEDLRVIRMTVAGEYAAFRKIVEARSFKRLFGDVRGERLVRVPRGFNPEHPAANYLRLKQFLASRTLPPASASTSRFFSILVETFEALGPLIRFLNEPVIRSRSTKARQDALLE